MIKVYRYGMLAPTEGAALLDEQIRLAHRYQNALIEIERQRRIEVEAAMQAHAGVAAAQAEYDAADAACEAAVAAVKATRARARKRAESSEQTATLREVKARRKAVRKALREAKRALRDDEATQARIAEANGAALERSKAARAASGLYWGTYLLIEQAVDLARKGPTPPRFRRWSGGGAVAVQIQKGLGVDEVTQCTDRRLQIDLMPRPVPGRKGKPRPRVRLRVGSVGRDPVWAEWPVILHRPLPSGATIKWAKAVRRRVCGKDEWSLHLTLGGVEPSERCGSGAVAVDVGWRVRPDDGLRVGYLVGEDAGRDVGRGEILLEAGVAGEVDRVEGVRAVRDRSVEELRPWLAGWLRERRGDLPEWLRERTETLPAWRAAARFASLAAAWRVQRFDGDAEAFERLEAWRKQDRHLWLWETHGRRGALRRRQDQYRRLGAHLARRYETLVLEKLDLRDLARRAAVDQDPENKAARSNRVLASVSELRDALRQAFWSRGGTVVEVPAEHTTTTCYGCGGGLTGDPAEKLRLRCSRCGTVDQDENAARNLLAAWREREGDARGAAGARSESKIGDAETLRRPEPKKGGRFAGKRRGAKGGARKGAVDAASGAVSR